MKSDVSIFQIGFNKCGTCSLCDFFSKNNIFCRHWEQGLISDEFYRSFESKEKPFTSRHFGNTVAITDSNKITYDAIKEPYKEYKYLHRHYPNSYFILNTRDREKWIRSRLKHGNLCHRYQVNLNLSKQEVIEYWRNEWDAHHRDVKEYFKDNMKFLVFDIERDSIDILCQFLSESFPNIDKTLWRHHNKTRG